MMNLGFLCIFVIFGCSSVTVAQINIRQNGFEINSDSAPSNVVGFYPGRATSFQVIIWLPVNSASYYLVKIYRRSDNAVVKEVQTNVTFANITGLQDGTNYTAKVKAVYKMSVGPVEVIRESEESIGFDFETDKACTGGSIFTDASGGCLNTCKDPDPVCSRVGIPGCACPTNIPLWHSGVCIPALLCPPPTAQPVRPTNVRSLRSGDSRNVIITWNPVLNASEYTVKVRTAQRSGAEHQSLTSVGPIISIPNLKPGVRYVVSVAAALQSNTVTGSTSSFPPPSGIFATDITSNGFRVGWRSQQNAARYIFALYDDTRTKLVYINDKIAASVIDVVGLAPGTTYHYAVASARKAERPGRFSSLREVRTRGELNDQGYYQATVFVEVPSTISTTTPTTTTTTTTEAMTHCRQAYTSVKSFYDSFPHVENGPIYPECDAQGLYVTKQCRTNTASECWCVSPDKGIKIRGTDFGGSNSAFQLNCKQVGSLNSSVAGLRSVDVLTSIMLVQWERTESISGYVLVLTNLEEDSTKTFSVDANAVTYIFRMLQRGRRYNVGIFAVNSAGWSTPTTTIEVSTLVINKPSNVQITGTTRDSATITWASTQHAEAYEVRLLQASTKQVIKTFPQILETSFTIPGLNLSVMYTVEVVALTIPVTYNTDLSSDFVYYQSQPTLIEVRLECKMPPLDLIYVYDSSYRHLESVKDFFVDISSAAPDVQPVNGTRVAAVGYHTTASVTFGFDIFTSTSNLNRIMPFLMTRHYGSNTVSNVTKALSFIQENFFTLTPSSRNNRKRADSLSVVIFFTEGLTDDIERISRAANSLKSATNLIAVGVSGSSSGLVLSALESRDSRRIVVSDYRELKSAGAKVIKAICDL